MPESQTPSAPLPDAPSDTAILDWQGRPIDPATEGPNTVIKVWQITPHVDAGYTDCVVRGYQDAVQIAKDTVEHLMDRIDVAPGEPIQITIKVVKMRLDDYLETVSDCP